MTEHDANTSRAIHPRGLDELSLTNRKNLTASNARIFDPTHDHERDHDIAYAESKHRIDGQRQQNKRERELDISEAHQDEIDPATEVGRKQADQDPDHPCDDHRHKTHDQRDARAVDESTVDVTTQ